MLKCCRTNRVRDRLKECRIIAESAIGIAAMRSFPGEAIAIIFAKTVSACHVMNATTPNVWTSFAAFSSSQTSQPRILPVWKFSLNMPVMTKNQQL